MFFKKRVHQPEHPLITLGTYRAGSRAQPFVLGPREVRSHGVVSGRSGFGKSSFLQSLALQYLAEHEPFSLADPHSDAARGVLSYLLQRKFFEEGDAFERLWYIKWSRRDCYVPFNVLAQPRFDEYTLAGHIHEAFARAFPAADGTTPLFSSILLPSLVVLIHNGYPITNLLRLITDKPWRDHLLSTVQDPNIHAFFERFETWGKGASLESTARRLHLLTFNPALRYSLGQRQNRFDFREVLDRGISVLHDLGGLDEETRRLLMCLLQVGYEAAALSREDLPSNRRTSHHLIVDEAASSAATSSEGFAHMLEQTRKFNLFLTLGFQSVQQLPKPLQIAAGNVSFEVAFRQTEADAKAFAHHFTDPASLLASAEQLANAMSTTQLHTGTTLLLERLGVQEARVRVGDRVATIATLSLPRPQEDDETLARLIDDYARRLATPADRAREESDGAPPRSETQGKEARRGYGTFAEAI
jgi:hypothetical protein